MRLCVHLDSARLFRWHATLIDTLLAEGHDVRVSFRDDPEPLPTTLTALFDYDHARTHAGPERLSTHINLEAFSKLARGADDPRTVVLDLSTASRVVVHPGRVLRPTYDGAYKDYALFHALLERRAPRLALSDSVTRNAVWALGLPANETPWRIAVGYDQITSRLIEGIARVLARIETGETPPETQLKRGSEANQGSVFSAASAYASARAARKIGRLKDRLTGDGAKWHVAWRMLTPDAAPEPGVLHLSQFRTLGDDAKRYFADPFVFVHEGRRHVFVEEVVQETGRGVISHFEIGEDGQSGRVVRVLEERHHLSYPFVFAAEDAIWMLPEASASGGLTLYRATKFPLRWEPVARIIGARVHDATLFRHEGRYWIAAAGEYLQSSSWDTLALYFAEDLLGPWQAHPQNPVLLDARAARPAGALWRTADGRLIRPAQDCSSDYGGRLTLKQIDRLDVRGFAETTIGQIRFPVESGILGPHTLSRGGGLELIDLYARPGTLRAGYRQSNAL